MSENGFGKLYWGILFIMIDFRLQGFDVLPDIIGYILFAIGFGILVSNSEYFEKARNFNIPMIILSLFSVYEKPAQGGGGIQIGSLGAFGILIGIASIILGLLVMYNLFMGIKDLAVQKEQVGFCEEADKRWNQYLLLQIAGLLAMVLIFIPPLALIFIIGLLIVSVWLTVVIMKFIKNCELSL
jgi:hypothetical protein